MKTIHTERCTLTPLTETDFAELTPLAVSHEVWRYLGGVRPSETAFDGWRESIRAANQHPFAVRLQKFNVAIGLVIVAPHHNPANMEVSFMLIPEYWGQGYARETLTALLAFCKQELGLSRVVAETQAANLRSRRLLESLGFVVENEVERFGERQCIYSIII